MNTVEVQKLEKLFKKNKSKAVDSASFNIAAGEVFGLIGPNGAGKTTTIQMMTTLLKPTSGSIKIAGFDTVKNSKEVRKNIGLVFQETILDEDLSAYDNLELHARFYRVPKQKIKQEIKKLFKLVGLEGREKDLAHTFSGGMKRRLEIARGLVHSPKVLFLDEPTTGLDPKSRRKIWEYIKKLIETESITIVLTTHYLEEADFLCNRVAIMNKGKIVALDTPDNLKASLGGDLIEMRLSNPDCILSDKFRKLKFVKKIARKDVQHVEITLTSGESNAVKIIEFVKQHRAKIFSFNLRKPTLDDVFLHYTGENIK